MNKYTWRVLVDLLERPEIEKVLKDMGCIIDWKQVNKVSLLLGGM